MRNINRFIATLAITVALIPFTPVIAQDIIVTAYPTFRDLEFDYNGQDRVGIAKASLRNRIPVGTPTETARARMRTAGAHCGAASNDGQTKCSFSSFESVEDHLHDVVWTIGLSSQHSQVMRIDVTRESLGS